MCSGEAPASLRLRLGLAPQVLTLMLMPWTAGSLLRPSRASSRAAAPGAAAASRLPRGLPGGQSELSDLQPEADQLLHQAVQGGRAARPWNTLRDAGVCWVSGASGVCFGGVSWVCRREWV